MPARRHPLPPLQISIKRKHISGNTVTWVSGDMFSLYWAGGGHIRLSTINDACTTPPASTTSDLNKEKTYFRQYGDLGFRRYVFSLLGGRRPHPTVNNQRCLHDATRFHHFHRVPDNHLRGRQQYSCIGLASVWGRLLVRGQLCNYGVARPSAYRR